MKNQIFPIFPYNIPMQIPIIDGGSLQNEEDVPEVINPDKIIENPVYYLKQDETRSKIVQNIYKRQEVKEQIFEKIKPEILDLSKNKFANYFIGQIIKDNDKSKIDFIYYSLKDNIKDASSDPFATHVVQELTFDLPKGGGLCIYIFIFMCSDPCTRRSLRVDKKN